MIPLRSVFLAFVIALPSALSVPGCGNLAGPEIAEVTGRVTVDGVPLEGVVLQFEPDESAVAPGKKSLPIAFGTTDADGRYRAFRTGNRLFGAAVGLNHVRITVPEGSSAKVHPRYMGDSVFWHEVGPGDTVIDLELTADPTAVRKPVKESDSE